MFRRKKAEDEVASVADVDEADMTEADSDAAVPEVEDDAEYEEYDDDEYEEDEEPRERDPLVGWMLVLSLMLVIVVVASTASVVFFLLGMRGAPRTGVERLVTQTEAAVQADPTADAQRDLVYAYMSAGRYDDADDAVTRGRKIEDTSVFDLAGADVLRMRERHEEAIKMYRTGEKRNEAEMEKEMDELFERGILVPPDRTVYASIMIGLGESLAALGRFDEALEAFANAAEAQPTSAYAHLRVGDMSAEVGKNDEAKAAYEEALRFIPGYEPALEGLEKLTDGSKE